MPESCDSLGKEPGSVASLAALAQSEQKPHWTGLALFSLKLAAIVAAAQSATARIQI